MACLSLIIKMLKRILGVFTTIFAITYFVMAFSEEYSNELVVLIFLGILMTIFTILLFKPTEKDKQKRLEKMKKHEENLKTCKMKHINGLPIAEDVVCNIKSENDKFIFSFGSMNFELEKAKIIDMCIKKDVEIQQQYLSSTGGAIVGAALLGTLGAVIGGRAKKKTVKNEVYEYFIITYKSPEIKYICFELTGYRNSKQSAQSYINEFKDRHVSQTTYQL